MISFPQLSTFPYFSNEQRLEIHIQFAEWSLLEKKTKNTRWRSKTKFTIRNTYYSKRHYHFQAILEVSLDQFKALLKAIEPPPPRDLSNHNMEKNSHTRESSKNINILKSIRSSSLGSRRAWDLQVHLHAGSRSQWVQKVSRVFKQDKIYIETLYQNLEDFPVFCLCGLGLVDPFQMLNHQGPAQSQVSD